MRPLKSLAVLFVIFVVFQGNDCVHADAFFDVAESVMGTTPPKSHSGIWVTQKDPVTKKVQEVWVPSIEFKVKTDARISSSETYAKVYFYDENKALLATVMPAKASHDKEGDFDVPAFYDNQLESLYFPIPPEAQGKQWTAVMVFGDKSEVATRVYPGGAPDDFDFDEKSLFLNPPATPIERKPVMDPLIEYVVHINNPKQPQLTLFLRPPIGMTDASQAQGVLALCLLGGQVDDVKKQLQGIDTAPEVTGILKFAEDHRLLILCWGARRLWDPHKNYDDQSVQVNQQMDDTFDDVANGWADGVDSLSEKYGFPNHDFLMYGFCGSAQYAYRLALRKPQYFLAVHVHIPGSFDKPTLDGRKVLWCLTTGELYAGYQRSRRFYTECRALGYPMIYKAFVGLGHSGSEDADTLGMKFFEYALSVKDQRDALDDALQNGGDSSMQTSDDPAIPQQPWLESFRNAPYLGDIVNQTMVPSDQADMIPTGFRTSLPTKDIADAWNK